ncbi:MAG TPA: carbonic anhydrase [Fimbriimonadaceae bacterium]|nr:carbonic anhydrase [Fimbriimonadaceae bacterium]
MNGEAQASLRRLLEGNERFRTGRSNHYQYPPTSIRELADGQEPKAAIIACVDGRVAPEILFDQPMGSLFVSRVPGNTASDSAKWMLEIAVQTLKVPLVIVLGHTDCLAVGQVVRGQSGPGGSLRMDVARAVHTARMKDPEDLFRQSVIENALQTALILQSESWAVRQAVDQEQTAILSAIYDVHSGCVEVIGAPQPGTP